MASIYCLTNQLPCLNFHFYSLNICRMEAQVVYYDPTEYVVTSQGNRISRKAKTNGTQNIILSGNSILMRDCILRGDLACIRMGKYCIISQSTIIRPPYKYFSKGLTFFPVHFGDYVLIEKGCVIVAVFLGSFVHIGENCVIGQSCVIKDCCYIQPNSVLMPDTVVPPFSIVGGNPATILGEWPSSCQALMVDACTSFFDNFQPEMVVTKKSFTSFS